MMQWLCVDGQELINGCRTLEYMTTLGGWVEQEGCTNCCCDTYDTGPYTTPDADNAPWYDPNYPVSAGFYGALWDVQTSAGFSSDTVAGRKCGKPSERVLSGKLTFYGDSPDALDWGQEWFFTGVGGCGDGCCNNMSADVLLSCEESSRTRYTDFRLVDWQNTDEVKSGLCYRTLEIVFEADPYSIQLNQVKTCSITGPWVPNVCFNWCGCPDPVPLSQCADCAPATPVLPPAIQPELCWCEPVEVSRQCCIIEEMPKVGDAVPVIEIKAIGGEMRNTRVRIWRDNIISTDPSTPEGVEKYECLTPCAIAEIGCIPADHTLTIDGVTESIYLTAPGGVRTPADHLVYGPSSSLWSYPVLVCGGRKYWACVDKDTHNSPDTVLATVSIYPRRQS